jgi:hypothetical protein
MKMKNRLALVLSFSLLAPALHADVFKLSWKGTAYSTDPATGRVVARSLSEKQFIQKVAEDNGLDPRTLVFVYRPEQHDTVVMRTVPDGWFADIIQMEYQYTEVSSADQTRTVRQAFLFDEYHSGALGSAFGTETARRDANGNLTTFSFRGTFQYAMDGVVYSGSFSTSSRIRTP